MLLDFEQIREVSDLEEREVEVPPWGGSVQIRGLSRAEVFESTKAATIDGDVDAALMDIELFTRGVTKPEIDRDGWVELCNSKSFAALQIISEAISDASGLGEAAAKKAEAAFRE